MFFCQEGDQLRAATDTRYTIRNSIPTPLAGFLPALFALLGPTRVVLDNALILPSLPRFHAAIVVPSTAPLILSILRTVVRYVGVTEEGRRHRRRAAKPINGLTASSCACASISMQCMFAGCCPVGVGKTPHFEEEKWRRKWYCGVYLPTWFTPCHLAKLCRPLDIYVAHHVAHAATALLLISPWRVSVSSSYTKLFCGGRRTRREKTGTRTRGLRRGGEQEEGLTRRLIPIAFFFFFSNDDGVPSAALLAFAHFDTLPSSPLDPLFSARCPRPC